MQTSTDEIITGRDAIEYARAFGVRLHKYADPVEGARIIDPDDADEIAAEDPSLLWCRPLRYVVMSSAAAMPSSCWGRYRHVAVVATDLPEGEYPRMISERAIGVVRLVKEWRACHVGKTERAAYQTAMREADALVSALERGADALGDEDGEDGAG